MNKKILFYFDDGSGGNLFTRVRDDSSYPFIFLKEKLFLLGYDLDVYRESMVISPDEVEWVLFINSPFRHRGLIGQLLRKGRFGNKGELFYDYCLKKNIKMALFLWEGKSVRKDNYSEKLFKKFSTIFTWADDLVNNKKFFKFYLPITDYKSWPNPASVDFKQKKMIANISRNRASSFPGELYSERKKSIAFFNDNFKDDFGLFGIGWQKPINRLQKYFPFLIKKYGCYKGEVKNKIEVLPYYKFAICYENLSGEKGYVTEKIFDCMNAGTVPIYWGAENIEDYVDPEAFIDRRLFRTNEELGNYLKNVNEEKYNNFITAIKSYLGSEKYNLFLPENFSKIIINTLKLRI